MLSITQGRVPSSLQERTGRLRVPTSCNAAREQCQGVFRAVNTERNDASNNANAMDLSRRGALVTLIATALSTASCAPAQAGFVEDFWLSRQRQNGGYKILAPIKVAQIRLNQANALLQSSATTPATFADALQVVRSASLNCYVFDLTSQDNFDTQATLIQQNFKISDPCTFRIIIKTVTGFATQEEKNKGKVVLDELIASFEQLDGRLEAAVSGSEVSLDELKVSLGRTIDKTDALEGFVKDVLKVDKV